MRPATATAHERRRVPTGDDPGSAAVGRARSAASPLLYSPRMASTAASLPTGFRRIFAWPRVRFTLLVSIGLGALMGLHADAAWLVTVVRVVIIAFVALFMFGWLERWPRQLPRWLPRTVLRLVGIAASLPFASFFAFGITSGASEHDFAFLFGVAMLIAPWIAIGTILRQRDAFAREQALEFDLQRSEFERRESDARLRLLQAQVEPHFLFNTLANVQALVDAGSPQASPLLRSLIQYLRAAVPLLESAATIERELQLLRPYLELMQMRMPDRLQYAINVDPSMLKVRCPPTTLLTLVENAVRHGIDPSEDGGRIDIHIERLGDRCVVRVTDSGAGLSPSANGLGTGLTTLRQRLQLIFGDAAHLRLTPNAPRGTIVDIDMPAQT